MVKSQMVNVGSVLQIDDSSEKETGFILDGQTYTPNIPDYILSLYHLDFSQHIVRGRDPFWESLEQASFYDPTLYYHGYENLSFKERMDSSVVHPCEFNYTNDKAFLKDPESQVRLYGDNPINPNFLQYIEKEPRTNKNLYPDAFMYMYKPTFPYKYYMPPEANTTNRNIEKYDISVRFYLSPDAFVRHIDSTAGFFKKERYLKRVKNAVRSLNYMNEFLKTVSDHINNCNNCLGVVDKDTLTNNRVDKQTLENTIRIFNSMDTFINNIPYKKIEEMQKAYNNVMNICNEIGDTSLTDKFKSFAEPLMNLAIIDKELQKGRHDSILPDKSFRKNFNSFTTTAIKDIKQNFRQLRQELVDKNNNYEERMALRENKRSTRSRIQISSLNQKHTNQRTERRNSNSSLSSGHSRKSHH